MQPESSIIGIIAISCWFGIGAIWIVCHYAFLSWKQWQATNLIRGMMERGYTPQEIIQMFEVLGHRPRSLPKVPLDLPPAKPIRQPALGAN